MKVPFIDECRQIDQNEDTTKNREFPYITIGFPSRLSYGNQAFVYAERAEAALAGDGYYFFLIKEVGIQ